MTSPPTISFKPQRRISRLADRRTQTQNSINSFPLITHFQARYTTDQQPMNPKPSFAVRIPIEKTGIDACFDQKLSDDVDWRGFSSTERPRRIWPGSLGEYVFFTVFSDRQVEHAHGVQGTRPVFPLADGGIGKRSVSNLGSMQLRIHVHDCSMTRTDELFRSYKRAIDEVFRATESVRIAQDNRVRDLLEPEHRPRQRIGASATPASGIDEVDQQKEVDGVASSLYTSEVAPTSTAFSTTNSCPFHCVTTTNTVSQNVSTHVAGA